MQLDPGGRFRGRKWQAEPGLKLAAEFISGRVAVLEKISGEGVPESGMLPERSQGATLVGARQRWKPTESRPTWISPAMWNRW
jgi:hypothetical protein